MHSPRTDPSEGVYVKRWTRYEGLYFDEFVTDSAWIRQEAKVHFPALHDIRKLVIYGAFRPHDEVQSREEGAPDVDIYLDSDHVATVLANMGVSWQVVVDVPPDCADRGFVLSFRLRKVALTNILAWLGRRTEGWPLSDHLQRFRNQNKNRQLRLDRIEAEGELVYDFSNRHAPYSPAFARKHASLGMNIVGFFTAELGVGESARCMMRACDASKIPAAAVALKLPCKARRGDPTYAAYLRDTNPYAVNVFHLDAPASRDIDHHHGTDFRARKYNIGYWAWELAEFPDAWLPYFDYFDEIWCPSEFVRASIAAKSPLPVFTMPHAIEFERPKASISALRAKFRLPSYKFLFLLIYDLNSYSERKNPLGAISAFRQAALPASEAALVVKVHGIAGNQIDLTSLRGALADLPNAILLTDPLPRAEIYELEAACDCFVSMHRSEGFGLAIAESMFLGKPAIATDWSATTEFLNESNGCPVRARLITLDRSHGPYGKGQQWADPETGHAADYMRRLFADRSLAAQLGAAARVTVEKLFSNEGIGARYRRRLEAIASW